MSRQNFGDKILQAIAQHLDAKEQVGEGISMENINRERWRDRYLGRNVPPGQICLNTFRTEVDMLVCQILNIIDGADIKQIERQ